MTNDGTNGYAWDADNRPTGVGPVSVTYDALGRAVEQLGGGSTSQLVYGPLGGKLAIMNGQTLVKGYTSIPGGATAVYNSGGLAYYRHPDWLGSSRLASTPTRTVYSETAYAPFGEAYNETGSRDRSFTGKDENTLQGLYDFPARTYSPTQSRWISPDPSGVKAFHLDNPQSLNRYAYVLNRPASLTDPKGLDVGSSACGAGECLISDPNWNSAGYVDPFDAMEKYFLGHSTYFDMDAYVAWAYATFHAAIDAALAKYNSTYVPAMWECIAKKLGVDPSALTDVGIHGGNENFLVSADAFTHYNTDANDCHPDPLDTNSTRCNGGGYSLHFTAGGDKDKDGNPTYYNVHMDTADPYSAAGLGLFQHFVFDVVGGNTWWDTGVPHQCK